MSDYTSWHVGMKVVCVDAAYSGKHLLSSPWLEEGREYTVRWIGDYRGTIRVRLDEVRIGAHEWSWNGIKTGPDFDKPVGARRFRPVQKRKTDISILKRLLTDPHVRIEEDA